MKIHNLFPAKGSKHRRKLLGRGRGSGHGGSCTRGGKGQTARSGESIRPGFEGGQMPFIRRIPKRGFTNAPFKKIYSIVNLQQIENKFPANTVVTKDLLFEKGLIDKKSLPLKILGDGNLTKQFKIIAESFSKKALEKIKSCGGEANYA